MKKFFFTPILLFFAMLSAWAEGGVVQSMDKEISINVYEENGVPMYSVDYEGVPFIAPSRLGLLTDIGDFTKDLTYGGVETDWAEGEYSLPNIKRSEVRYNARVARFSFLKDGKKALDVVFFVKSNDIAFRYEVYPQKPDTKICRILEEATTFVLPEGATSFICPQMPPMAGFARTTPSYETPYKADELLGRNGDGFGYTFPCLFRNGDDGWVLLSETGVSSSYCGSRLLGHPDRTYKVALPMEEEFNGNGTSAPGITTPGSTPWRTITLGKHLGPIVETTIPWDVVEPLWAPSKEYTYSKGSWSWIIKMDPSMNFETQIEYIDFSAEMGWQTVLVDALWDTEVGRDGLEKLAAYAKSKGVQLFVWYNSNGYWNDAPQGPRGIMDNVARRRKEMAWLQSLGVKGIKVDFIGSDKQVAMQLYEDILYDANDYGLLVVFHGCTLPRGWERMYPNFASAEAVVASENLHFSQHRCDEEAFQATIIPFARNAVASMDFGGSALNKIYNTTNDLTKPGSIRKTSDVFALATAVLFQSPVQHFALAPNNIEDAPSWAVDFMKNVPTTWDEISFVDGYPGKYVIIARKSGDHWYVAGINAQKETLRKKIALPYLKIGEMTLYSDSPGLEGKVEQTSYSGKGFDVEIPSNGAFLIVQ